MVCSTIEVTLEHALFLARHLHRCGLQYAAIAILLELGIPTHRDGFDYLKNSIVLFCADPTQVLSKGIYLEIGQMYSTNPDHQQIENAIRSAIDAAWRNRNEKVWRIYFLPGPDGKLRKPTALEFISRIGYFLELWEGCCKEVSYEK